MTTTGFYSIVEKPDDADRGTLTIRSRVRSDLENLRDRYLPEMGEISESTASDYRYRSVAPREAVSTAMARAVIDIDYSNFKDAVGRQQSKGRAEVYGHVWGELYRLQSRRFEEPQADARLI